MWKLHHFAIAYVKLSEPQQAFFDYLDFLLAEMLEFISKFHFSYLICFALIISIIISGQFHFFNWIKFSFWFSRMLHSNQAPVLDLMFTEQKITIHNVRLFLGIIKRRTNTVINRLNYSDQPSKVLAKRDRVPKFNISDAIASLSASPSPHK